ncbi:heat shock factor protein 2-like isoform 2-T2 [Rhinophrynus dorsalis]
MKPGFGVPKFLTKIWALVEDPRNQEYICWSQDGNSFIVVDEERFAKEILPRHFKHSNMASFVRQLNWYGFHKVLNEEAVTVKQEKYCSGRYQHVFFKRGQIELLTKIKRKVPVPRIEEDKTIPDDNHQILAFLHQLQGRQDAIDSTVESLKRENKALWKEVLQLRQKPFQNQPQYESVSPSYERIDSLPTHQPLMIDNTGNYNQLSEAKTAQNIEQAYENSSEWTVNGCPAKGTKRAFSIKEDNLDNSTEEHGIPFYQPGESDNLSDVSSSDSEEMANEDSASEHSPVLPGTMKTLHRTKVPNKLRKRSRAQYDCGSECKLEYSGSEDADDHKTTYADSGHVKKKHKTCRSSCFKTEHMLKQMHKDNTCLTKRVLALEQQTFQKLSEISTVLSTLANYIMNTGNLQRPLLPHFMSVEGSGIQQNISQTSQSHHIGTWPEIDNYLVKKHLNPRTDDKKM